MYLFFARRIEAEKCSLSFGGGFRIIMARTDRKECMNMKKFSYEMTKNVAAHAKPLCRLIQESGRFASMVTLRSCENAPVIRLKELLTCGLMGGSTITVTVEGKDEEAAVAAIQNYIVAHF